MKIVRYYFVYIFFSHTFISETLLNFPDTTKTTKHHEYYLIDENRTDFGKWREILERYPVPLAKCTRIMCSFLFAVYILFCFFLQHSFFVCNVSVICRIRFLVAAYFFYLHRSLFVCSISFLFAGFLFCLQCVPCGPWYVIKQVDVKKLMKVSLIHGLVS